MEISIKNIGRNFVNLVKMAEVASPIGYDSFSLGYIPTFILLDMNSLLMNGSEVQLGKCWLLTEKK